jgi:hypothetical protein
MKSKNLFTLVLLVILFLGGTFLTGCESEMDYQTLVKNQLESEIRNDSLFLGYYFGMGREEFRDYSWQLNQDGVLTGFVEIDYQVDFLKSKATMSFYPEFQDEKIVRMPVTIGYDAWAPWNEQFWPEVLVEDLKEYYENEYDAEFTLLYVPEIERQAFVSIDGNREIRIYKNAEATAMVDFIDLNSVETVSMEESE